MKSTAPSACPALFISYSLGNSCMCVSACGTQVQLYSLQYSPYLFMTARSATQRTLVHTTTQDMAAVALRGPEKTWPQWECSTELAVTRLQDPLWLKVIAAEDTTITVRLTKCLLNCSRWMSDLWGTLEGGISAQCWKSSILSTSCSFPLKLTVAIMVQNAEELLNQQQLE